MSTWRAVARLAAAIVVALAGAGAACARDENGSANISVPTTTLHVFAASSLTEAFTDIGTAFEKATPGVHVVFNFAASSALAQQVIDGATADVFVSADEANMQ